VLAFVKIGVVKVPPAVPAVPVFEPYQTTFPVWQVAVKLVEVPEQMVLPVADGPTGFGRIITLAVLLKLTQLGIPPLSQATK
jgi:hypothetical protein